MMINCMRKNATRNGKKVHTHIIPNAVYVAQKKQHKLYSTVKNALDSFLFTSSRARHENREYYIEKTFTNR